MKHVEGKNKVLVPIVNTKETSTSTTKDVELQVLVNFY